MPPPDQIQGLKSLYPEISIAEEGGLPYLRIENLKLPEGADPQVVTSLLCPAKRDGYQSRLFLAKKISHKGPGINWNADGVVIQGEKWWAVSWQTPEGLPLLQMLLLHLRAFRA